MQVQEDRIRFAATDLSNHLACLHLTTLDRAVALGRLPRPNYWDPKAAVLRERGLIHERVFLEHLRAQGCQVVEIDAGLGGGAGAASTEAAMREGVQVIAQATLRDGDWHGRADVLHRVEQPSCLGPWSYEVVDTKLAMETRAGTVLQLCVYSDLLERVQGVLPEYMYVVAPGQPFTIERLRVSDFGAYYRFVKGRLETAVAVPLADARTYPVPTPHCEVCRWWSECDHRRREDDHLCLVAGIRRLHERELQGRGVRTLTGLAGEPLPITWKPERGAAETYARLREQARVQYQSRGESRPLHELLPLQEECGLARLPQPSPGDVFLDLEGDPLVAGGGQEYLLGYVVLNNAGQAEYRAHWALDRASEKAAFERFVDDVTERWRNHAELHIYHYAPYEPSALKRLMSRHATREDEVDRMLRAGLFVDLHAVFRQALRAGVEQYSIKSLEAIYGFTRSVALPEAAASLRAVESALELGCGIEVTPDLQQRVEEYNRDDCVSALQLRNWLEERRSELIAAGTNVLRPAPQSGETTEQLAERRQRVGALAVLLLEGVPVDPHDRSPEQQARWLLAQLLDWHRREEKVAWWEYFRLAALSDEERVDEPAALSGLEFVGRIDGTPKCPVDRYRFPAQEVHIGEEADVYISAESKLGKVVTLDAAARTVDIRKMQASRDKHPTSVFAHKVVSARPQADALYRLGEWVVENGIDVGGPYRAARDLLLHLPPRRTGSSGASLRNSGENAVVAARRLALELDGGVLPVQGPHGAGKTYAGARMILELVRSGRKVGITALSHKVIRNLLNEVVRAARDERVALQCIQKVDERSEVENPLIEETKTNDAVLGRLNSGEAQVAAGTCWLWSRPEFARAVDVLVVDEAGQMSLANAVAIAQAATSIILIGDPRQLEQPLQGTHPEGSDVSPLEHLIGERLTIPEDQGLFLEETWRLHPSVCAFTSEQFYEGRLHSRAVLGQQLLQGPPPFDHSGLFFVPVEHEGNQNSSPEEAEVVATLVQTWVNQGASWIDVKGDTHSLTLADVLIVAPYNAHVAVLAERLPGARIGTVDKFQGQEAPVVIYSMATSSPEEAPRGMEFLYNRSRLNVATSRARCACVLVASPRLFEPECRTPRQMQLANALCRYLELAQLVTG